MVLHRSDRLETMQTDRQVGREMIELIQLRDRPRQAPDILVRYDCHDVLTLDERHFRAVRVLDGEPFQLLPFTCG